MAKERASRSGPNRPVEEDEATRVLVEGEETRIIRAQASADVERLQAWQHFVLAVVAVTGTVVLAGLRIMPIEVASNVITSSVLVLVLRRGQNGGK